ncbi:MAG: tRNA (guanosine(46)-N7)-methyltransferase TrmB [Eubacteriales bacterium]|nr:tRNA (guanosine(46)-N7)-methyltransferase TrmB [Eubacteriales bacterium]
MRLKNVPGAREAVAASPFVIQEPEKARGRWAEIFGNPNPIFIEVGMGKGKFITELALAHPERNYIGIERYSSVLLRALQKRELIPQDMPNLYYLCIDAQDMPEIFAPGEVSHIYLNFSDPWPKDRHAKRRLPSRQFLERYDRILAEDGKVEFKTDNRGLFDFALEEYQAAGWTLEACTFDLHHDPVMNEGNVMTEYEEKFSAQGNPIHKMIISRERAGIH